MNLEFIYTHIDGNDEVYNEIKWAFPLPNGLKEYHKSDYRITDRMYIDRNNEPINGLIYDYTGNDYSKITLKNGQPFCYDDLPSHYTVDNKLKQSDPTIDYIRYEWKGTKVRNLPHRLGGPASIHCQDQEVIYFKYFVLGYPMDRVYPNEEKLMPGYKISHWFIDNGIDFKNMSDQDKELFKMKWNT